MQNKKRLPLYIKCLVLYCIPVVFMLTGCGNQVFYQNEISIPDGKWKIGNTLDYEFEIVDTSNRYDIYYTLTNTLDYPYSNLYVCYYLEDGQKQIQDTLLQNITLMNSVTGEPFGENYWGINRNYSHELLAVPAFKFKKAGKYVFRLKQYMRQDPIPEILNVGIKITVVKPL